MQAIARVAGQKGLEVKSIFYLNIYTAPCYMMIVLSIVNVILVFIYFHEDIGESKNKFKEEQKRLRRGQYILDYLVNKYCTNYGYDFCRLLSNACNTLLMSMGWTRV